MRALVAYFSASGVTAGVAKKLSDEIKAELYEIRPALAYSQDDLDWRNGQSRSSIEMQNKSCRPKLSDLDAPVAKEDIIDSFLDAYDFTGKKIVLFATSGSSDIGEEAPKRVAEISGTSVLAAKRFPANVDASELKAWAEGF